MPRSGGVLTGEQIKDLLEALPTGLDHGSLAGLEDDDHPQYQKRLVVDFPHTLVASTNFLKRFVPEQSLEEVIIAVEIPFDVGLTATVGFPGTIAEVMGTSNIDLQTVGIYKASPYKLFTATQTLNLYFSGLPTTGKLVVYVIGG